MSRPAVLLARGCGSEVVWPVEIAEGQRASEAHPSDRYLSGTTYCRNYYRCPRWWWERTPPTHTHMYTHTHAHEDNVLFNYS